MPGLNLPGQQGEEVVFFQHATARFPQVRQALLIGVFLNGLSNDRQRALEIEYIDRDKALFRKIVCRVGASKVERQAEAQET